MKRLSKTAGALGLIGFAAVCSPVTAAEDSGWYGGVSIGQSRAKIDDARISSQLLGAGMVSTTIADSNHATAYKLFGGYQYSKHFSVEAGYFDLGKFGYTATTVPVGTLNGNIKLKGFNLDAVGTLPLTEKISALARLGLQYTQAKDNFSSTGAVPTPFTPNPGKNAFDYKAGLGVQYDFNRSVGMRVEAERYRINDAVGNKGDINLFSLGLIYRFGDKSPKPAPTPPPVAAAEPVFVIVPVVVKTQEYCSILDLQFEIKKDDIQREDKEKLAVVGTFMNKYPDTTAIIEGHADNIGTVEFNQKLSQRRADSVVAYLVDELKIAPARLKAVGYGDTRPIADNSTILGQQANRRISAVIACARDVAGLKVDAARITMAMEMEFDPYKSEIEPQYRDGLVEVASFMKRNPGVTATVEGYAGKYVGKEKVTPELAMQVSERRAQAVVNYLVNKLDVPRSRLSTKAYGQTRRVAYSTTLEGQQENRRVNIVFNYPPK